VRLTIRQPERRGTTLVELTVVVVLFGLILGGLLSVMNRQQRFYRETSLASATRSQVRQAAEILPAELRGLTPSDIVEALDSALEFRSTIASGVVCEQGADWIAIAPLRPSGARAFRGELLPPAAGDIARVLIADPDDPARDRWLAFAINEVTDDPDPCASGPFVVPADGGQPRLRLTFDPPPAFDLPPGSPLRITRPVRYSLYRSSDRRWHLGANEMSEGRWSGIQPVSGPYAAYGAAEGGIHFEYLDEAGAALEEPVDPGRVALIRLIVRPLAGSPGTAGGAAAFVNSADSAIVDVALRNRFRSATLPPAPP
jgi:type II secretory pathway pseudopilin PulG